MLVKIYKITISRWLDFLFGRGCRYSPTCSCYFEEAVSRFGIITGGYIFLKRFLRCHPFSKHAFYDPVPGK